MTVSTELLEAFRAALEAKLSQRIVADAGAAYSGIRITLQVGMKNARIVRQSIFKGGQVEEHRSAYGFINLATGSILKADGWKRPAKGVRGSITADDLGLSCCGPYSVAYLR